MKIQEIHPWQSTGKYFPVFKLDPIDHVPECVICPIKLAHYVPYLLAILCLSSIGGKYHFFEKTWEYLEKYSNSSEIVTVAR